jgi:hypothetical protein
MSHHGAQWDKELEQLKAMHQELSQHFALGATGDYPDGKLCEHDQGALRFAVFEAEGKVILQFNTSVAWLGLSKSQALELGEALIDCARL